MAIGIGLGVSIAYPFLALLPAGIFAFLFFTSKRPIVFITALAWLTYFLYEQGMKLQILCSGECNIRIDLLLIYPVLLILSAMAVFVYMKHLKS